MTRIANDARPAPLSRPTETSSPPNIDSVDVDGAEDIVTVARADVGARFEGGGPGFTVEGGEGGNIGKFLDRPLSSDFKDVAVAIRALEKDFGVKIKGDFSAEELSRVHESLRLMGKVEREAMKGIELRREPGPRGADAAHGEDAGAIFKKGSNVDTATGARLEGPSITFYDKAFPVRGSSAQVKNEDRRTSMHVVLHEVGHAIEGRAIGDAIAAKNEAATRLALGNDAHDPLKVETDAAREAFESIVAGKAPEMAISTDDIMSSTSSLFAADHDPWSDSDANAAVEQSKTSSPKPLRDPKTLAFKNATSAWHRAQMAYVKATKPEAQKAALTKLKTAEQAVQKASQAMPADHPAKAAATRYASAITDGTKLEQQDQEQEALLRVAGNKLGTLVDKEDETLSALEADFQEATEKDEPITLYGESAPVENFAEAYAIYRRDPSQVSNDARRFFDKHLPL